MRNMQALGAEADRPRDGAPSPRGVRVGSAVGVPSCAKRMPEAPAGGRADGGSAAKVAVPVKRPTDRSGITRRVWLFMLEHGGRWHARELCEEFHRTPKGMDRILRNLERLGNVSKYRRSDRKNGAAFGVSSMSRIPHGLTLRDVTQAVAIQDRINSEGKR